jgi:hypothetical protein
MKTVFNSKWLQRCYIGFVSIPAEQEFGAKEIINKKIINEVLNCNDDPNDKQVSTAVPNRKETLVI